LFKKKKKKKKANPPPPPQIMTQVLNSWIMFEFWNSMLLSFAHIIG